MVTICQFNPVDSPDCPQPSREGISASHERTRPPLETDQPLVGNVWGAADCAIQANLAYLPLLFPHIDLAPYPSIQATIKQVELRPAYRKAMGQA